MKRKSEASSSSSGAKPKAIDISKGVRLSSSALQSVFLNVQELGMPSAASRQTQRRQIQQVAFQRTSFGPLLTSLALDNVSGGTTTVWYAQPLAHLEAAIARSDAFEDLFFRMAASCNYRLRIAFY